MRVTTKGQVTIPLKIREKLNIKPSTEVDFVIGEDGRVYIEKRNDHKRRENGLTGRWQRGKISISEATFALTRSDT